MATWAMSPSQRPVAKQHICLTMFAQHKALVKLFAPSYAAWLAKRNSLTNQATWLSANILVGWEKLSANQAKWLVQHWSKFVPALLGWPTHDTGKWFVTEWFSCTIDPLCKRARMRSTWAGCACMRRGCDWLWPVKDESAAHQATVLLIPTWVD